MGGKIISFGDEALRDFDEFTFRLNEGTVAIDTLDRRFSLCRNIGGTCLPYRDLVANHA